MATKKKPAKSLDQRVPVLNPRKPKPAKADGPGARETPDLSHIHPGLHHLARPVAELNFDPENARRHDEKNIDAVIGSLTQYGYDQPLVVQEEGMIVRKGNCRLTASLRMGHTHVPALVVNESRRRAIGRSLADNRSAELGSWDEKILDQLMREVDTGPDPRLDQMLADLAKDQGLYLTGGDAGDAAPDPGPQTDKAAELQKQWRTAPGQLWVIPSKSVPGKEHRLLCGDSTKAEDVARVMGSQQADACVTDPPYGVGVNYGAFEDTESNVARLIEKVMPTILGLPCAALTPGVPAMWSYPKPVWVGAWVHPAPAGGCPWGFVGNNPILYYGADPYLKAGLGRRPDSVVMVSDRQGVDGHPTPKPLKVWTWLVERLTTEAGQIIYEPFAGSGTTFVAGESAGRLVYGIELESKYIAVILERLAGLGLEPRLADE